MDSQSTGLVLKFAKVNAGLEIQYQFGGKISGGVFTEGGFADFSFTMSSLEEKKFKYGPLG
jgi:ABC-type phosphate transport system substrate-binding protein